MRPVVAGWTRWSRRVAVPRRFGHTAGVQYRWTYAERRWCVEAGAFVREMNLSATGECARLLLASVTAIRRWRARCRWQWACDALFYALDGFHELGRCRRRHFDDRRLRHLRRFQPLLARSGVLLHDVCPKCVFQTLHQSKACGVVRRSYFAGSAFHFVVKVLNGLTRALLLDPEF